MLSGNVVQNSRKVCAICKDREANYKRVALFSNKAKFYYQSVHTYAAADADKQWCRAGATQNMCIRPIHIAYNATKASLTYKIPMPDKNNLQ